MSIDEALSRLNVISSEQVTKDERECIEHFRKRTVSARHAGSKGSPQTTNYPLTGLALSGGGVRAATFHLGVLQGLAQAQILPWVDYISSVSGGAFTASWMAKWLIDEGSRDSNKSYGNVLSGLDATQTTPEPRQIRRLRQYTAYMTPRLGPFGQDSILFLATYCHQFFAYSLVMLLGTTATLLTPYLAFLLAKLVLASTVEITYTMGVGTCLAVWGLSQMVILFFGSRRDHKRLGTKDRYILGAVLIFSVAFVVWGFWHFIGRLAVWPTAFWSTICGMSLALLLAYYWEGIKIREEQRLKICAWLGLSSAVLITLSLYGYANTSMISHNPSMYTLVNSFWSEMSRTSRVMLAVLAGCFSALSIVLLKQRFLTYIGKSLPEYILTSCKYLLASALLVLFEAYAGYRSSDILWHLRSLRGGYEVLTFVPFVLTVVLATFIVLGALSFHCATALLGRFISSYVRESTTRCITFLYRYAGLCLLIGAFAFYGPVLVNLSFMRPGTSLFVIVTFGLVMISINLVFRRHPLRRFISLLISHTVAYALLLGFFSFVGWLVARIVLDITFPDVPVLGSFVLFWTMIGEKANGSLILVAGGIMLLLFCLSARFGVNSSSMHSFYQARLSRAYLDEFLPGAQRLKLYSESKNLTLDSLVCSKESNYVGPYVLINAALNLGGDTETAWQERLSTNFVFSPLFFGYEIPLHCIDETRGGYARSTDLKYGGEEGVRLAHAMAISGSAVGSNMGLYTSPRGRFLNTLLNFRLGWWFPNPCLPGSLRGNIPRSRINLVWRELMGKTNDQGPYIYLSDGGHFENIGLYELIRRECRIVVVADASEDAHNHYGSLGNAIERCRADMGVNICVYDPPFDESTSPSSYLVGRIRYQNGTEGILLCLKARKIKDLPLDVRSFAEVTNFPHHSTIDQWFGESQFESYRVLGSELALRLGRALKDSAGETFLERVESLANAVRPSSS